MPSTQHPRVQIRVRVIPGASRNQIVGVVDGAYKIKIAAQPVKGKANKALKEFIAKILGVRKSDVQISTGENARIKTVLIEGIDDKSVARILSKT